MKTCEKCKKSNREQARYCRFCGEELVVAKMDSSVKPYLPVSKKDILDELVGLDVPKNKVRELVGTVKTIISQRGKSVLNSINMNVLITGPSGSGKSRLLFAVGDYMRQEGMFKAEECETFSPLVIETLDLAEKPLKAIVLDDAHKLLPADKEEELTGTALEYIFENSRLRLLSGDDRLVIIVSGSQEFQDYVDKRPELKNQFALNIRLPEYSPTEVAQICEAILRDNYNLSLAQAAREKLCRVFNYERRHSDKFGNAHLAASKANELMMMASRRSRGKVPTEVVADDVTGREYVPKTLEEVMQEFDKYVGVDEIKNTMVGIVNSIKSFQKLHPDKTYELKDHYLFLGNPGTGKTTMARVFADALSAMGILPSVFTGTLFAGAGFSPSRFDSDTDNEISKLPMFTISDGNNLLLMFIFSPFTHVPAVLPASFIKHSPPDSLISAWRLDTVMSLRTISDVSARPMTSTPFAGSSTRRSFPSFDLMFRRITM